MYCVQEIDLFGFRDVFHSQTEKIATEWQHGLEKLHGNRYRTILK